MTNGEFVSGILNDAKLLNKDTYIPRRHVLDKARSIVRTYVAQRLDSFDLSNEFDIVTTVPCVELESVDYVKCGSVDLAHCRSIMRTKSKLPDTINGRITFGVLRVTAIDGEYEFKIVSPQKFRGKMQNRYVRDKERYALIQDGYLVLPNSEVEAVSMELISFDDDAAEDCGCGNSGKKKKCKKLWDKKFICPSNIFTMVRDKTMQEISSTYLQIRKDENPNMDENIRTQTTG